MLIRILDLSVHGHADANGAAAIIPGHLTEKQISCATSRKSMWLLAHTNALSNAVRGYSTAIIISGVICGRGISGQAVRIRRVLFFLSAFGSILPISSSFFSALSFRLSDSHFMCCIYLHHSHFFSGMEIIRYSYFIHFFKFQVGA